MPSAMEDLCERLAAGDARLHALYEEHMHDHGELLGHVFFGVVASHYEALCASGQRDQASFIVSCIDAAATAAVAEPEAYVDNVIHVSFLEALPWQQKSGLLWELLTPRLKAGYDLMHGYGDPP